MVVAPLKELKERKNMERENNSRAVYVGALLVIAVLAVLSVRAFSGSNVGTLFEGDCNDCDISNPPEVIEEMAFGAVAGPDIVVDSLEYGAGLSKALNFTATATSTVGGLVNILNPRHDMVCREAILNIHTADTAGGPAGNGAKMNFSLGTSTSASGGDYGWSGTPGIIATTTLATGTVDILTSYNNPGALQVYGDFASTTPFVWTAGEYIVGAFSVVNTEGEILSASSTAHTGTAGRLYLDCFVE